MKIKHTKGEVYVFIVGQWNPSRLDHLRTRPTFQFRGHSGL